MRYTYEKATYDLGQLTEEVLLLALPGFAGAGGEPGTFWADYEPALSGADEDALGAAVTAHVADPDRLLKLARAAAKALIDEQADHLATLIRAVVILTVEEVNNPVAARLAAEATAVSLATSLQNLQTRWAAAAGANPVPSYTPAQARTAIKNSIDDEEADE